MFYQKTQNKSVFHTLNKEEIKEKRPFEALWGKGR
jgi:hypothetical protein